MQMYFKNDFLQATGSFKVNISLTFKVMSSLILFFFWELIDIHKHSNCFKLSKISYKHFLYIKCNLLSLTYILSLPSKCFTLVIVALILDLFVLVI